MNQQQAAIIQSFSDKVDETAGSNRTISGLLSATLCEFGKLSKSERSKLREAYKAKSLHQPA